MKTLLKSLLIGLGLLVGANSVAAPAPMSTVQVDINKLVLSPPNFWSSNFFTINVKQPPFNALGNGTTNDTAAIQAAIDAGAGKAIFIPAGTYRLVTGLTITNANTRLFGAGREAVILRYEGAGAALTLSGGISFCVLEDLSVESASGNGTAGIKLSGAPRTVLRNVRSSGFSSGAGVELDHSNWVVGIYDPYLTFNAYGLLARGGGAAESCNALNVLGGDIAANGTGVLLGDPAAAALPNPLPGWVQNFIGVSIEGNTNAGLHNVSANLCNVRGCYFESQPTAVRVGSSNVVSTAAGPKNCVLDGNWFFNSVVGVEVQNGEANVVKNNYFTTLTETAVKFSTALAVNNAVEQNYDAITGTLPTVTFFDASSEAKNFYRFHGRNRTGTGGANDEGFQVQQSGKWTWRTNAYFGGETYHSNSIISLSALYSRLPTGDTQNRFYLSTSGAQEWGDGTSARDTFLARFGVNSLRLQGGLSILRTNATDSALLLVSSADSQNRFLLNQSGRMEWGSGSAARDTFLYRNSAGELASNSRLTFVPTNSTDHLIRSILTGDATYRFAVDGNGLHEWGSGAGARDVNLYRDSANVLKTDDALTAAAGNWQVDASGNTTQAGSLSGTGAGGFALTGAESAGDPATPAAGTRTAYFKTGGMYEINSAGVVAGPFAADTDTGITQLTGDVTAGPGSGSQAATIASATSATWAGRVSDETGTGVWVFANSPALGSATWTTNLTSTSGKIGLNAASPAAAVDVTYDANNYTRLMTGFPASTALHLSIKSSNNASDLVNITGTGTGDLLELFDNTTSVFRVKDGGAIDHNGTLSTSALIATNASSVQAALTVDSGRATNDWRAGSATVDTNLTITAATGKSLQVGTTHLVVTNGMVGIGTASPGYTLDVNGQGNFANFINVAAGYGLQAADVSVRVNGDQDIITFLTANIEQMRINSSGNVGIGDTAPAAKLSVAGATTVASGRATNDWQAGSVTVDTNLTVSGRVGFGTAPDSVNRLTVVGHGTFDTLTATNLITASRFDGAGDGSPSSITLWDADHSNHVRHQSPNATTGNQNYIWPAAPSTGFLLATNSATTNMTIVVSDSIAGVNLLHAEIGFAASDETTAITAGTAKFSFRMPYAMTVTSVRANLVTAQTSGTIFTVDINESGATILSTKLTIDNGESTSQTAAAPPVISDSALADDAVITVDVDQIGDSTAKGLKLWIIGNRL